VKDRATKTVIDLVRERTSIADAAALLKHYNTDVVGIAWYSPAAWKRLEAMPEADIQKSYREYVRATENAERGYAARGIRTTRLTIHIDQMIAWCHRNGYKIDSTGRSIFGTVLSAAQDDPMALDRPVEDNITRSVQ
jgi:hypothetical protein